MCQIDLKLTIKTPEQRLVLLLLTFEHIFHFILLLILPNSSKQMLVEPEKL